MPRTPRTVFYRLALATASALLLAACADDPTPTGPSPATPPSSAALSSQGAELQSSDDLDRQIPGFGGFFLASDGTPTVYLTRGSSRAPAERALGRYLGARGLSNAALRVAEARYGWAQLQRWQDAATDGAFEVPGTVFVDNDETTNRILIGVENLASSGQVRAALARAGLPDDAVTIQRTEPIVQVATLRTIVDRPVRAGVQINFPGYICSVGFNATKSGQASFVTASHCTNVQGGAENTPYWQPLESVNGTQIATEVDDPAYGRNLPGCPRGNRVCRYSDAARAAYTSASYQALGRIASTSGANNNSLEITGTLTIEADDCNGAATLGGCMPVGTTINKIGRTTGWTRGVMTNKCVNTGVSGTRIVQLCQNFVTAGVAGGDSGSGTFYMNGNQVVLAGILWGGGGSQFVFSPLGNVIRELGAMTAH